LRQDARPDTRTGRGGAAKRQSPLWRSWLRSPAYSPMSLRRAAPVRRDHLHTCGNSTKAGGPPKKTPKKSRCQSWRSSSGPACNPGSTPGRAAAARGKSTTGLAHLSLLAAPFPRDGFWVGGGGDAAASLIRQLALIAMRLTFWDACSDFGRVMVSTPSRNFASALSSWTASSGIWRTNDP